MKVFKVFRISPDGKLCSVIASKKNGPIVNYLKNTINLTVGGPFFAFSNLKDAESFFCFYRVVKEYPASDYALYLCDAERYDQLDEVVNHEEAPILDIGFYSLEERFSLINTFWREITANIDRCKKWVCIVPPTGTVLCHSIMPVREIFHTERFVKDE